MKKVYLFLITTAVVLTATLAGCSKKDDAGSSVPDPEGTMTANISQSSQINIGGGYIAWAPPDNFDLVGYGTTYNGSLGVSICDLGEMRGLGNITSIPQAGYIDGGGSVFNTAAACEVGHGYVIKAEYRGSSYSVTYVRLYVQESIVSTSGGVMGAKVKYQYPFTDSGN